MQIHFGFYFGGFIVSIICAAISYVIAERNGMNRIGWTLLGFILSFIGLLITFLVAFSKTKDARV